MEIKDGRTYFQKCLQLLEEYMWIYDFKMTNFFVEEVWCKIPNEWLEYFEKLSAAEVFQIPSGRDLNECPSTLRKLIADCVDLNLLKDKRSETLPAAISLSQKKFLSEKKKHEIEYLAPAIANCCKETNCRSILDIGCGLGYLAKVLADRTGCSILGVDSDAELCSRASDRNNKDVSGLRFCNLKISNAKGTVGSLVSLLERIQPPVLIVCLHGCGDLQPTLLQQFAQLPKNRNVVGLFTLGCCYHKMSFQGDRCLSFPLSSCGKETFSHFRITPFGLRLAAQETMVRWFAQSVTDHQIHTNSVAFRGILALLESQGDVLSSEEKVYGNELLYIVNILGHTFRKTKRRLCHSGQLVDFKSFVKNVLLRTDYDVSRKEKYRNLLMQLEREYRGYFSLIEPFTALQVLLQGPLESLLLFDRFMFLKEQGLSVNMVPVFDASVSPRNMLLTAFPAKN